MRVGRTGNGYELPGDVNEPVAAVSGFLTFLRTRACSPDTQAAYSLRSGALSFDSWKWKGSATRSSHRPGSSVAAATGGDAAVIARSRLGFGCGWEADTAVDDLGNSASGTRDHAANAAALTAIWGPRCACASHSREANGRHGVRWQFEPPLVVSVGMQLERARDHAIGLFGGVRSSRRRSGQ